MATKNPIFSLNLIPWNVAVLVIWLMVSFWLGNLEIKSKQKEAQRMSLLPKQSYTITYRAVDPILERVIARASLIVSDHKRIDSGNNGSNFELPQRFSLYDKDKVVLLDWVGELNLKTSMLWLYSDDFGKYTVIKCQLPVQFKVQRFRKYNIRYSSENTLSLTSEFEQPSKGYDYFAGVIIFFSVFIVGNIFIYAFFLSFGGGFETKVRRDRFEEVYNLCSRKEADAEIAALTPNHFEYCILKRLGVVFPRYIIYSRAGKKYEKIN